MSARAGFGTAGAAQTSSSPLCFCPNCANLLLVDLEGAGQLRYFCQTCPYIYDITRKIARDIPLVRKQVDDVLGGAEAWKNVDKSPDAVCPKCSLKGAFYMQVQTRSADEPMSIFYKCCAIECGHRWREG